MPDLAAFDAEITKYRELAETIGSLRSPVDIAFLRVNSTPIKFSLASLASSWASLFLHHLTDYVTRSVAELQGFIAGVEAGLAEDAGSGKESLQRVMAHIRDVRKSRYVRKAAIGPLRRALALLKKHGVVADTLKATVPPVAGRAAGGDAPASSDTEAPPATVLSVVDYLEAADLKVSPPEVERGCCIVR